MKQNEKSNGSLRERWAERLARPAPRKCVAAHGYAPCPESARRHSLQEAVHASPGSGQMGSSGN